MSEIQVHETANLTEFWKENHNLVILPTMFSMTILSFAGLEGTQVFFAYPVIGCFSVINILIVKVLWEELRKKTFSWGSYLLVLGTTLTVISVTCFSILIAWFNFSVPSLGFLALIINLILGIAVSILNNRKSHRVINQS